MKNKTMKTILLSCLGGLGFFFFLIFGIIFLLFATCVGYMTAPNWLTQILDQVWSWIDKI